MQSVVRGGFMALLAAYGLEDDCLLPSPLSKLLLPPQLLTFALAHPVLNCLPSLLCRIAQLCGQARQMRCQTCSPSPPRLWGQTLA